MSLKISMLRFPIFAKIGFQGDRLTIFDTKKGTVFDAHCDCQTELFIFAREGSFSGGRDVLR